MKKGLRFVAVLALSVLALTSCTSKVEFSEFKTKANAALEKTVEYTSAKVTDKSANKNYTFTVSGRVLTPSKDTAVGDVLSATGYATVLMTAFNLKVYTAADLGTGYTYYAGDSFKVEYSYTDDSNNKASSTFEWNSYGLPTSINGKASSGDDKTSYKLTVSYSK